MYLPTPCTVEKILRQTPLDRLETRILLKNVLSFTDIQLAINTAYQLSASEQRQLIELLERRIAGEPIAYLTGQREFYGRMFSVTPEVLIPRPESELLVDLALERLIYPARILELGTGSGAIAVTLACENHQALIFASDVSSQALQVAQANAQRHQAQVCFLHSNWYEEIGNQPPFDLILANPPYIAQHDPHLAQGDLRFEPRLALSDGADGLSALRTIISGAPEHLQPGAWLLLEHGFDQSAAVRNLLSAAGFKELQSWRDLAGIERVSGGRVPEASQR